MKIIDWTGDKIAELVEMKQAGRSASEIAKVMRSTRSAILGKLHRLGFAKPQRYVSDEERQETLARRALKDTASRRIRRQQSRGDRPMMQAPKIAVVPPPYIGAPRVPFADLRDFSEIDTNECRYIDVDQKAAPWLACGNATLPGHPYCGKHERLCCTPRGLQVFRAEAA